MAFLLREFLGSIKHAQKPKSNPIFKESGYKQRSSGGLMYLQEVWNQSKANIDLYLDSSFNYCLLGQVDGQWSIFNRNVRRFLNDTN